MLGCTSSTGPNEGDGDGDGATEPNKYSLSVSTNPSDGGTVEPSSGTYEEGNQVTVEATASNGWQFIDWTGDRTSEENPLAFTISENIDLTANFEDRRSMYRMEIRVIDANDTLKLGFGQLENATEGFDTGIDKEAPPPPPEGALNAYFEINDLKLFQDFKNSATQQAQWTLKYQIGSGQEVSLEWELTDDTQTPGTLTLTDGNSSFEVNMFEESSTAISNTTLGSLIISYNR